MDSNEIENLAKYRIDQAKENLEEADALFNINKFLLQEFFMIRWDI